MKLKFTKEVKSKWLEALKSGDYIQGVGKLRTTYSHVTEHCCFGVLSEVCGINNISENGFSTQGYKVYEDMLGRINTDELWMANDRLCDGKYTAVIPIIEQLPTTH